MDVANLTATKYEDALIPKQFYCLNWALKPFCLGHYILLERLNSPVVKENIDLTYSFDLPAEEQFNKLNFFFDAVFICCMTFEQGLRVLEDEDFKTKMRQQFDAGVIAGMDKEFFWPKELYAFKQYIKYFMDVPLFKKLGKQKQMQPSGSDWKQTLFVTFMEMNYPETKILNLSFKRLFYEWTTKGEASGAIRVRNTNEIYQMNNPATVTVGDPDAIKEAVCPVA